VEWAGSGTNTTPPWPGTDLYTGGSKLTISSSSSVVSVLVDRCHVHDAAPGDAILSTLPHYDVCLVAPRAAQATDHSSPPRSAVSIILQLNLKPAVHISLSRSLFHVFLGRPLRTQMHKVRRFHTGVEYLHFQLLFKISGKSTVYPWL